jgi:hypothetical protein
VTRCACVKIAQNVAPRAFLSKTILNVHLGKKLHTKVCYVRNFQSNYPKYTYNHPINEYSPNLVTLDEMQSGIGAKHNLNEVMYEMAKQCPDDSGCPSVAKFKMLNNKMSNNKMLNNKMSNNKMSNNKMSNNEMLKFKLCIVLKFLNHSLTRPDLN